MNKLKLILCILLILTITYQGEATKLVVAVIDTGFHHTTDKVPMCSPAVIDFTGLNRFKDDDKDTHGSNIASLIAQYAGSSGYCIQVLKVFKHTAKGIAFDYDAYIKALNYILKNSPYIVNMSIEGYQPDLSERYLVSKILDKGIKVVAAAGNYGVNLDAKGCIVYPACTDKRIVVVGNSTSNSSNYGSVVDVAVDGSNKLGAGTRLTGTSQSTAIETGLLVKQAIQGSRHD